MKQWFEWEKKPTRVDPTSTMQVESIITINMIYK